jgi:adenine phosphoribosyltransferase
MHKERVSVDIAEIVSEHLDIDVGLLINIRRVGLIVSSSQIDASRLRMHLKAISPKKELKRTALRTSTCTKQHDETMSFHQTTIQRIKDTLRVVPNYPFKGVNFRDIQPLLSQPTLLDYACQTLASYFNDVTSVAGLDARGFIFGSLIAQKLGVGFVMLRKPSKLPGETHSVSYGLEYGQNVLHVQKDSIKPTDKVLIVDDILVTGGSVEAACKLVEQCGAKVAGVCCLADIVLSSETVQNQARARLSKYNLKTLVTYDQSITSSPAHEAPPPIRTAPVIPNLMEHDTRAVILYYPTMEGVARQMVASHPFQFRLGHVSWKKFPDGMPNIEFDALSLERRAVVYLGSLYDIGTVMPQFSLVSVLPRQHIRSLHIVFPYFAPGTMERVEREGVLATAETFARILASSIPPCQSGPATLRIYDIHALPNRFYFTDNVTMRMLTAIDVLKSTLHRSTTTIAFPDEGAFKRFKHLLDGFPMVICSKVRDGDKRVIKITEHVNCRPGFLENEEILIVDDLVQTGGTLFECKQALVAEGAKRVSAYVTHPVFPNDCFVRFLETGDRSGFFKFYVTDSVPEVASKLDGHTPFHVLRVGSHLAADIVKFLEKPKSVVTAADVILASVSKVKVTATQLAIKKVISNGEKAIRMKAATSPDAKNFVTYDAKSLVPEQPFGDQQTVTGATNRLLDAVNQLTDTTAAFMVIAIENGVFHDSITGTWYDQAVVLVRAPNGTTHQTRTDKVTIPDKVMKEWFETRGNRDACDSIGQIVAKHYSVPHDDWYSAVSKPSRADLLAAAVSQAIASAIQVYSME